MARPDLSQLKALLESARLVSVLLPQNPSYDSVASGLALKLSLESLGKSVAAACPDSMTVEFNPLVGVDTLTTSKADSCSWWLLPNPARLISTTPRSVLSPGQASLISIFWSESINCFIWARFITRPKTLFLPLQELLSPGNCRQRI